MIIVINKKNLEIILNKIPFCTSEVYKSRVLMLFIGQIKVTLLIRIDYYFLNIFSTRLVLFSTKLNGRFTKLKFAFLISPDGIITWW